MNKAMKWAALGLGTLVLVLVLAMIFLPKLLNLESVKNYVTAQIENQIDRPVAIEKIRFSIFSGVNVENVEIGNDERFSKQPAVKIKKIVFSYNLWDLIFKRKVSVNEAGLVGLQLVFEQQGRLHNFSSFQSQAKAPQAKPKSTQKKGPAIQFDVKKIFVKDSAIRYTLIF